MSTKLREALQALADLYDEVRAAQAQEQLARGARLDATRRATDKQCEVDALLAELKKEAPTGTAWATSAVPPPAR